MQHTHKSVSFAYIAILALTPSFGKIKLKYYGNGIAAYKTHLPCLENQDLAGIRELMLDILETDQTIRGTAGVVSDI